MTFQARQLIRTGTIHTGATLARVFPLLCPKREEEWIPGWECETLSSSTGYNEEGAVFRTTRPYGTELYWTTLRYDLAQGSVGFIIIAPGLFLFRFNIRVTGQGPLAITFEQTFTAISERGNAMIEAYSADDFAARMRVLESFMNRHLHV